MSVQQWSSPSLLLVATARSGVNAWDLRTGQSAFSLPASPQQVHLPPSLEQLLSMILPVALSYVMSCCLELCDVIHAEAHWFRCVMY